MYTKTWHVEVFISEDGDDTAARAVLHGDSATTRPEGFGRSRRAPSDTSVPEVGDEIAAARALHALADRLLAIGARDIEAIEHQPVRLNMSGPAAVSTRSRTALPMPAAPTE
jgi:hypothetical protein